MRIIKWRITGSRYLNLKSFFATKSPIPQSLKFRDINSSYLNNLTLVGFGVFVNWWHLF